MSMRAVRQLLPDDTILSWPEYRACFSYKDPTDDVKTVNMYELLGPDFVAEDEQDGAYVEERLQNLTLKNVIDNASGSVSGNVSGNTNRNGSGYNTGNASANSSGDIHSGNDAAGDDSDGGGWQTVVNNSDPGKRHRRVVNQQQDCPYGLRCKKQDDCGYRHTGQERRLFRQNLNQNLGKRKTQMSLSATAQIQIASPESGERRGGPPLRDADIRELHRRELIHGIL
ncbi:c0b5b1c1-6cb5-4cdf-88b1-bbb2d7024151 [Thermothielavioides terrestris]|uniref:C0b5b1c1-6cb5-4cdf-88b1-bbb2d7024151 n=1 Tax=Thermothielavioides terrestris TaxID=2587410 RepID=A0A446BXD7_9PEZI|nr:c0b5b1c1-6cb5-4cdf-88b1-bbb2d7024151 [Thermothielavioides terrestris]